MIELIGLLTRHGSWMVLLFSFVEQIGLPVPAVPVFIVAAAIARTIGSNLVTLLLLATAGSVLADSVWFFLGRRYGQRILGLLCRISLSPDSCVRKTESFFERRGLQSLVVGKFLPGLSLVAPPMAGASGISYLRFLPYDIAGGMLWAGGGLALGAIFSHTVDRLLQSLESLGSWALLLLGGLLALFIAFKWWDRRRFYKALRMARISVEELRERLDEGRPPVILDVRSRLEQTAGKNRIPGAREAHATEIDAILQDISPDEEIVLYCT